MTQRLCVQSEDRLREDPPLSPVHCTAFTAVCSSSLSSLHLFLSLTSCFSPPSPPDSFLPPTELFANPPLLVLTLVSTPLHVLLLLLLFMSSSSPRYNAASPASSALSICPITPERQSGTVLPVIRPRGGPCPSAALERLSLLIMPRRAVCGLPKRKKKKKKI